MEGLFVGKVMWQCSKQTLSSLKSRYCSGEPLLKGASEK